MKLKIKKVSLPKLIGKDIKIIGISKEDTEYVKVPERLKRVKQQL